MYTIYQLKKTIFSMEAAFAFAVALGCYIFFGEFYIQFDHDFLDTFTRVQDDGLLIVIFPMLVSCLLYTSCPASSSFGIPARPGG